MNKKALVILAVVVVVVVIGSMAFYAAKPRAVAPSLETQSVEVGSHDVALVPPGFTSPFHGAVADGARAAAAQLGWKLDVVAPESEGDFSGQAALVQKLLNDGTEAVSINPIQEGALVNVVKAANAKGVPIFMHNFTSPFAGAEIEAYIGYDQWGGAEKLGTYTCDLLAKKYDATPAKTMGKVFILRGIEGLHAHRRTQGYKAGLAAGCPNVTIVGEQTADWLRDKGAEVATSALQKNPDIDVFYGNSDEMAIGAAAAAEKLGLVANRDFFALSIDGNKPTLDLIKEEKFTATLGVDPYRMGQVTVATMAKVLQGQKVPQVVMTPSVIVTKENLEDYTAGKTWTEPTAGNLEIDNGQPTFPKP